MALSGEAKLFHISHRHLLQSSIFLLSQLLCLSTAKDSESVFYAHLQRSILCSRKIRPRKFREMQGKTYSAQKSHFPHVSRLKFTLMCHKQIIQHQSRAGLKVHRIKGKARHYSSYMTLLEYEGNKIYRLKGFRLCFCLFLFLTLWILCVQSVTTCLAYQVTQTD